MKFAIRLIHRTKRVVMFVHDAHVCAAPQLSDTVSISTTVIDVNEYLPVQHVHL